MQFVCTLLLLIRLRLPCIANCILKAAYLHNSNSIHLICGCTFFNLFLLNKRNYKSANYGIYISIRRDHSAGVNCTSSRLADDDDDANLKLIPLFSTFAIKFHVLPFHLPEQVDQRPCYEVILMTLLKIASIELNVWNYDEISLRS